MTYDWQTTFAQAIHAFGDTPGPQLEQHIRDTFTQHPQAVTNAIAKIVDAHQAGRVRSPWGALRSEIDKQVAREAIVDSRLDARKYVLSAEQFIRNEGLHYTWPEAVAELRRRPKLAASLNDTILARLETLWTEMQPTREALEADELARAEEWKETRANLDDRKPLKPDEIEPRCSKCGQTEGHADDCPLVLRANQLAGAVTA